MDGKVLNAAQRLQRLLAAMDPKSDRDTFVWAHGFLTAELNRIQKSVPDLVTASTLLQIAKAELAKLTESMGKVSGNSPFGDEDSLEAIERSLDDPGDAPVPAKKRPPRPKRPNGGVALPIPKSDSPI